MPKKRKADTEKATALFETVSSLWNEQVRQSFVAGCTLVVVVVALVLLY